jgi:ABC-type amino acid transport substrate-binding protein
MRFMKSIIVSLFLSLSLNGRADSVLHVGLSDVPPFSYKENDEIKGINYDILKQIEKKSGQKFQYDLYPHARLSNLLENENPDLLIMFANNCTRHSHYESSYRFYTIYPAIFIKKSFKNADKTNMRMARLIGTCSELSNQFVKKELISNVESMEQALEMLRNDRVDSVCGMESVINYSKSRLKDFKEILVPYKTQSETHDFDAVLCLKKSLSPKLKKKLEEASKRIRIPEIK